MSAPALRRFLGLPAHADDRALLGFAEAHEPLSAAAIEEALRQRLARIDRHPDRDGPDAAKVRVRLRRAADRLQRDADGTGAVRPGANVPRAAPATARPVAPSGHPLAPPRTPPPPQRPDPRARPSAPAPQLTPFDRIVLATLISHGGWNAQSRARLMSIAVEQGVGVDGLMKVVNGVAAHARSDGSRGAQGDSADGAALVPPSRIGPIGPTRLETFLGEVEQAVGEELRSERLAPRLRITALFALATCGLLFVLVRVLLVDPVPPKRPAPLPESALVAEGEADSPREGEGAAADGEASGQDSATTLPATLLAKFTRPPSFSGERRPAEALRLLERSRGLPALVDSIARRLAVRGDDATVSIERDWQIAIDEAAGCWPLMDRQLREQVIAEFAVSLRAATPSMGDRLLALTAPTESPTTPAALWGSALRVGLLAEIAARGPALPSSVTQRASALLLAALAEVEQEASTQGASRARHFDLAAGRWLDHVSIEMVQRLPRLPSEEAGFENLWEAWFEAQAAVRERSALQTAFATLAGHVLRAGWDLAVTGPPSDLLGRLAHALDFNDDVRVRSTVLGWFADPRVPTQALWVLTSLMARDVAIRWFGSEFVLDWEASNAAREELASRIGARWPQPTGRREAARAVVIVPSDSLEAWRGALRNVEGATTAAKKPAEMARCVLLLSMLNEAAASFQVDQLQRGRDLVNEIAAAVDPSTGDQWPRRTALLAGPLGAAQGIEGEWTTAYEATERSSEQRLAALRQLRTRPGGDLFPRDAETLVKAALRGGSADLRLVARGVIVEAFRFGPNVMLELLDQLPDTGETEELSELVYQLTERTLPASKAPEWPRAARLAMLTHVLLLRPGGDGDLDALGALIAEVSRRRLELARVESVQPAPAGALPHEAHERVVDAWRFRSGSTINVHPIPASLVEIDRRRALRQRLAGGAVTRFVAEEISHLDLTAFVLSAQAPHLRDLILDVLAEGASRRDRAATAMEQSAQAELALARLWELAFTGEALSGTTPGGAADPSSESPADESSMGAQDMGGAPGSGAPPGSPTAPSGPTTPRGTGGDRRAVDPIRPPGPDSPTQIPAPVRPPPPPPPSRPSAAARSIFWAAVALEPAATAFADRWQQRLERLDPSRPLEYFELAEEMLDAALDEMDRERAKHLFALSGALDPVQIGRAACLALASIAEDPQSAVRLQTAAALLDRRGGAGARVGPDRGEASEAADLEAAMLFSEAMSFHRRGLGPRVAKALEKPAVNELLERHAMVVPGGADGLRTDAKSFRGQARPALRSDSVSTTLRLEVGLLAGINRPWSSDILMTHDQPLVEVDPGELAELLGADSRLCWFRGGTWTAVAGP